MNIITVFFARLKTNPNFVKYGLPSIIVVPLLADIITGVFDVVLGINLPFSALIRALILFFGLLILFTSSNLFTKYLALLSFVYFCLSVYWLFSTNGQWVTANVDNYIKIFFPLFCFLIFYQYIEYVELEPLLSALSIYGLIAAGSIIFFFIVGVGRESYGDYTFGVKGVFVAGNDIGIAIILSSMVAWYRLSHKLSMLDIVSALISFIGLVFIASRTGLLVGTFVVICGVFSYLLLNKSKNTAQKFSKIIIVMLILTIIFAITTLVLENIDKVGFHIARIIELFDGVSPREHLEFSVNEVLATFSLQDQLFGVGQWFYLLIAEEHLTKWTLLSGKPFYKNAELDFIDLYGQTGLIFTLLYCVWICIALVKLIKSCTVNYASRFCFVALFSFIFLLAHAAIAGHIFFGTQVPIVAAAMFVIGMINIDNKVTNAKNGIS